MKRSGSLFFRVGLLSLFSLNLLAASQDANQPPPDPQLRQLVDSIVQPFLKNHNDPGAIVAISIHGRRSYFTYGVAREDRTPFSPSTVVEIGSCTKVFTTTLFALAINRHQMDPNASIQKYMPNGYTLEPLARRVTPRELALFTSGMPDDPPNLPPQLEKRSIEYYTSQDFLKWVSHWQPGGPPPAPYKYSNSGNGLLGYLVAEATHTPWEAQVNREIIGPLAMGDTEMRPGPDKMLRMAQGHTENGRLAPPWPIFAWYPAGSLRSTAVDMLNFGEANLFHKQVAGHPVSDELTAAMKLAQTPIYRIPNEEAEQGMAWASNIGNGDPNLAPETLKNGGTVGFSSVIMVNRRKDIAIFIAINKQGSNPAPLAVRLGRSIR